MPPAPAIASRTGTTFVPLINALRPGQWVKNGFVAAPLLSSGRFLDRPSAGRCAVAVLCFCLLSSAVYLFNDLCDRERDRLHPEKRYRAVASGALSLAAAGVWCGLLLLTALGLAGLLLPSAAACWLASYAGLNLVYSLWAKHVAVLDILLLAAGFTVRVLAGAASVGVKASDWLLVVTLFFTLFLALLKRRAELVRDDCVPAEHRVALLQYTPALIDQLVTMCGGCVLLSYSLYTFNSVQPTWMMATIPFVVFAVFRSLLLVHQKGMGSDPADLVLRDGPMRWNLTLFVVSFAAIVAWSRS